MYTAELTSAELTTATTDRLRVAAVLGFVTAALIAADSLLVDAFGNDAVLPNLLGVAAPPLGIVVVTGLYAHLAASRPGRLLDAGYLLNVVGLALVTGIDVTRTLVFARLDEQVLDDLLATGPTRPALFAAGVVYIVGTVLFGLALVRRRYATPWAWLYVVTAVPSGLVVLLPDVAGALALALAAASVAGLSLALWRDAARGKVTVTS
jgi:hypothetical protein